MCSCQGDREYHGPVIWPRDAPYLYDLALRLGEVEVAKEILVSNLEASVDEGAIFHLNELYSLPLGVNPSPGQRCEDPVPVKNASQLWNLWSDAYLGALRLGLL